MNQNPHIDHEALGLVSHLFACLVLCFVDTAVNAWKYDANVCLMTARILGVFAVAFHLRPSMRMTLATLACIQKTVSGY